MVEPTTLPVIRVERAREPHKVMTPEEYAAMKIEGWHEVCCDIDNAGNIGIRYLGMHQQ